MTEPTIETNVEEEIELESTRKDKKKWILWFVPLLIIIVVIAGLLWFDQQGSDAPIVYVTPKPTEVIIPTATPEPIYEKFTGAITTSYGGSSPVSFEYDTNWELTVQPENLMLTKESYAIEILPVGEVGGCIYTDDPNAFRSGHDDLFSAAVVNISGVRDYRRPQSPIFLPGSIALKERYVFPVCQKQQTNGNEYYANAFGSVLLIIRYTVPEQYVETYLGQMDRVVSTFETDVFTKND